jgi:hypothetical protein
MNLVIDEGRERSLTTAALLILTGIGAALPRLKEALWPRRKPQVSRSTGGTCDHC